MKVTAIKTEIFKEGDSLIDFILKHTGKLKNGDVLVITSKIVALAERRTDSDSSRKHRQQLIKAESEFAVDTEYENVWLTMTQGMMVASAGIDESNANGKLILLPKNSYTSADKIRKSLMSKLKLHNLGIVITDSRVLPFRAGAMGVAVGYAGLKPFKDYRGKKDIFGREFVFETSNIPDALASAAVLEMGEGDEQQPLALIQDAAVEFAEVVKPEDLVIPAANDLYRPMLNYKKPIE